MSHEVKRKWMARILSSGLDNGVITPGGVLDRVTPKHLAEHLPAEVMAAVLQSSLEAGSLTPNIVIETLGVEGLAAYVPPPLLWEIIADSIENSTMAGDEGGRLEERTFLGVVLESAMELGMIAAEDVLNHITPSLVMEHAPLSVRTSILEECLKNRENMTAQRLIEIIGVPILALHLPVDAIWAAVSSCNFDDPELDMQVMDLKSTVEPGVRATGRVRRKIAPSATRRRRASGSTTATGK